MQPVIPLHLLLATAAKVLCSAVFVSKRDETEAMRNSAFHALKHHQMDDVLRPMTEAHVDGTAQRVTMTLRLDRRKAETIVAAYREMFPGFNADWNAETERLAGLGSVSRSAQFLGDQGCAILRQNDDRIFFEPVPVRSALPDAKTQPWPNGDLPLATRRSHVDRAAVASAIDAAFREKSACTAAVVVLHHGELVGERYALGAGPETQLESWSMGKSVTATLIGVLVEQGLLTADQPAPIPAWRQPGDPRAAITVRDLLQMSSGLLFSGQDDPREKYEHGLPDHLLIYAEAIDVFEFAASRPVEFPPQTVGRYRNCDPISLGFIIKDIVTNRLRQNYLQWPQAVLFDRIGVRRQVLETDLHGNFIMSGFDYGTARNWALLGLLYLQDGVWEGKRVLPAGWARLVGTAAPAWDTPRYGGQFWVNQTGEFELPRDAYYAAGAGHQHVFIVPSADLVVVRLGHRAGDDTAKAAVDAMLRELMRVVSAMPAAAN
ncbi:MAG TPA: serine hydrolase [Acetobacteraceae bacterium]|nr:serine hydrolase [Acetobacteraceae bacterium]